MAILKRFGPTKRKAQLVRVTRESCLLVRCRSTVSWHQH